MTFQGMVDISACIITFNQKAYIERAIRGAVSQQFSKDTLYEIVISDDCSDDGTSDICRDYAGRFHNIRYIRLAKRSGATSNFRETLQKCEGKYIAICEGDDYWTDDHKLQKQISYLDSNPGIGLVHTDVHILYNDSRLEENFYLSTGYIHNETGDIPLQIMKHEYRIFTCTVCLRKEIAGFYLSDVNYENFQMGDTPLWVEAARHSGIRFMPFTSAVRRLSSGSLSFAAIDRKQIPFFESGLKCLKYIQHKYGYDNIEFTELFRLGYYQVVKVAILTGDREAFIKYYNELKDKAEGKSLRRAGLSAVKIFSGFIPAWIVSVFLVRIAHKLKRVFA